MKSYDATATIEANPDAVWAILADAAGYSEWDSGVVRVEGRITRARRSRSSPRRTPGRTFPSR